MKNTLIIDNFLIIKHVEIDVKRYNVLIGPQASGKSIIAKLLYLFYQFSMKLLTTLNRERKVNDLKYEMVETFLKMFPEQGWNNQDFKIIFSTEKGYFSFEHKKTEKLSYSFSNEYENLISRLVKESKDLKINKINKEKYSESFNFIRLRKLNQTLVKKSYLGFINQNSKCIFIPAGRSILATISSNIFFLVHNEQRLDFFFTEFASVYEFQKRLYGLFDENKEGNECKEIQNKLIKGIYLQKNDIDCIRVVNSSGEPVDVEVSNASSGQQELLPILLTVANGINSFLMIEEPEAHIFPEAQYDLIRYIISKHTPEDKDEAFLFTTHSPYILTAMNNLVYAGLLAKKLKDAGKEEALQKLEQIYSKKERIPADELSAYYVEGGEAKDIVDSETGLIYTEEFDAISNTTSDKFDQMMELELENQ